MEYTHPKRYEGIKSVTEHSQNIIRNRVEKYCLKCDIFMGKEHDFSECRANDEWKNDKLVKIKTCPFPNVAVSLIEPQVKYKVEES